MTGDAESSAERFREMLEQPIQQDTELAAVIKLMNQDKQEPGTNLRQIDFLTRIAEAMQAPVTIHDSTIALHCLPIDLLMTTAILKRNRVSLEGKGREESVQIASASMARRRTMLDRLLGRGMEGQQPL